MALDLEIVGPVRVLDCPTDEANEVPMIKRLRDSHHAIARLLARGVPPHQVALQTGYSSSRISTLQNDPAFNDLVEFYRQDVRDTQQDVEATFLSYAKDVAQIMHERILDNPDDLTFGQLTEAYKAWADRGGFAPISRSINKNLNVNLGARFDAAKRRKDEAA